MSRIGKLPIEIPEKVEVSLSGRTLTVSGPRGELKREVGEYVEVVVEDSQIDVRRPAETREARGQHGLMRSLIAKMVEGVNQGFKRSLEINGVGYRAKTIGRFVQFDLGYSHPIMFELPEGVSCVVERQTNVTLESNDKELLGQVAAKIRSLRKPEPYKGKGIKYSDEVIIRKAGKSGA